MIVDAEKSEEIKDIRTAEKLAKGLWAVGQSKDAVVKMQQVCNSIIRTFGEDYYEVSRKRRVIEEWEKAIRREESGAENMASKGSVRETIRSLELQASELEDANNIQQALNNLKEALWLTIKTFGEDYYEVSRKRTRIEELEKSS